MLKEGEIKIREVGVKIYLNNPIKFLVKIKRNKVKKKRWEFFEQFEASINLNSLVKEFSTGLINAIVE